MCALTGMGAHGDEKVGAASYKHALSDAPLVRPVELIGA